jgi:hypothetical protein
MKRETREREEWSGGGLANVLYTPIRGPLGYPPVTAAQPILLPRITNPTLVFDERASVDASGPKSRWKPFEHYKMVLHDGHFRADHDSTYLNVDTFDYTGGMRATFESSVFGVNTSPGTTGWYGPQGLPSWRDNGNPADEGFIPLPTELFKLEQMALAAIMPRIKAELSILNAVYELKDFKHLSLIAKRTAGRIVQLGLKHTVLETLKGAGAALSKIQSRPLSRQTLHTLSQLAAGTYLQWKFAFAPLISDIQSTWAGLFQTEKKLRKFLDNAEKVRTGHFSVDLAEYSDVVVAPYTYTKLWGPAYAPPEAVYAKVYRNVLYKPSKFHVEIEYTYVLSDLQLAHSRLFAYLDAFGVNLNPAIIWNAIPYTFLLDWVVGVSNMLSRMAVGFMDPVVFIHQYLWSITRERTIYGGVSYPTFGSYVPFYQRYELPTCVETAYRRETQMPSKSSFITTSGLSPVEISLGSALLITRRRRRYRTARPG